MGEFGGSEIFTPGEGGSSAPEALSEEAKQRFAAAAAGMKALQREEKKSKKRDDRVARTIIQFLGDERYTHLFVLISRLVARDCPSIYILSVLSLIDRDCLAVVHEYLREAGISSEKDLQPENMQITEKGGLNPQTNRALIDWITRMQAVIALNPNGILLKLMVDEKNIDGTVLQLSTFVLDEFFKSTAGGRLQVPFETLHPLTASILQTVFEPFLEHVEGHLLQNKKEEDEEE